MAENVGNGDKNLENSLNHKSEKPSDIKIPIGESDSINSKQESENIPASTKHLHNSSGKNIRHYFFEFLMMFLAVFLRIYGRVLA